MSIVITKTIAPPPVNEKEILRYADCKKADSKTLQLIRSCLAEAEPKLTYRVCFTELPVKVLGKLCDFDSFTLESENLAKNLEGCQRVILFGATVGVEIDRLIAKYSRISPVRALMLSAIGSERIEALCDAFCDDIIRGKGLLLKPRFSPGYGDLPLEVQKKLFTLLDCPRKIGLSLNDSLVMSPEKSVTAFAGLTDKKPDLCTNKCSGCNKTDCNFREMKTYEF